MIQFQWTSKKALLSSLSPHPTLPVCVESAGSLELQAPHSSATCVKDQQRVKSLAASQAALQALLFVWNPQVYRELAALHSKLCNEK